MNFGVTAQTRDRTESLTADLALQVNALSVCLLVDAKVLGTGEHLLAHLALERHLLMCLSRRSSLVRLVLLVDAQVLQIVRPKSDDLPAVGTLERFALEAVLLVILEGLENSPAQFTTEIIRVSREVNLVQFRFGELHSAVFALVLELLLVLVRVVLQFHFFAQRIFGHVLSLLP